MLATVLLAAATALPLGAWPETAGPAARVIDDVEFYLVEPEDDYFILAVQPLETPLRKAEEAALRRLVATARKLGADAVLLLGELPEASIPDDVGEPLPTTGRFAVAVFVVFDEGSGEGGRPVPSAAGGVEGRGGGGRRPARIGSLRGR